MRPAGLQEVKAAKADGRWKKAYDPGSRMEMPADSLRSLSKNKIAKENFETLNKVNTYTIGWRLHTAYKCETREQCINSKPVIFVKGEKFHG